MFCGEALKITSFFFPFLLSFIFFSSKLDIPLTFFISTEQNSKKDASSYQSRYQNDNEYGNTESAAERTISILGSRVNMAAVIGAVCLVLNCLSG